MPKRNNLNRIEKYNFIKDIIIENTIWLPDIWLDNDLIIISSNSNVSYKRFSNKIIEIIKEFYSDKVLIESNLISKVTFSSLNHHHITISIKITEVY